MRTSRKLQVVVAVVLGAAIGAALAGQLSANNSCSSDEREGATGLVDTSGVCASDYCGCFEDLSRSRVLTCVTPK
jgi:hypothetical protein